MKNLYETHQRKLLLRVGRSVIPPLTKAHVYRAFDVFIA